MQQAWAGWGGWGGWARPAAFHPPLPCKRRSLLTHLGHTHRAATAAAWKYRHRCTPLTSQRVDLRQLLLIQRALPLLAAVVLAVSLLVRAGRGRRCDPRAAGGGALRWGTDNGGG